MAQVATAQISMRHITNVLAYCAGVLNFAIVLLFGVGIGYMSGATVSAVTENGDHDLPLAVYSLVAVLCYVVGAFVGGFLFPQAVATWNWQVAWFFFLLGLLLLCGNFFLDDHVPTLCLAAIIGGAQNGLGLQADGKAVSTTHFSAYLEKFGRACGQALRMHQPLAKTYIHRMATFGWFLLGNITVLGTFHLLHTTILYLPAVLYILVGLVSFYLLRHPHR